MVWRRLSGHPATVPLGLAVVVVLQLVILNRGHLGSSASRGADAVAGSRRSDSVAETADRLRDSASLLAAAKVAFAANDSEKAVAALSAMLAREPANSSALDLYRDRLHQQFENAISERDWELAQVQIAAYDSAIRAGLIACASADQVESLWRRQEELRSWASSLEEKIVVEADDIAGKIDGSQLDALAGLEARLQDLPTARLTQRMLERLVDLSQRIAMRQNGLNTESRKDRLAKLRAQSEVANLGLTTLRELQTEAETLHSEIVEAEIRGGKDQELLTASRGLLGEIDRRLQIKSLHEMQAIADADAAQSLKQAKMLLETGRASVKEEKFQTAGEKLAEAELVLGAVDRLASVDVQLKARKLADEIRREAIAIRSQQERKYNLWAICQLEQSIADYKKAAGFFNDDEEAFKKILREKVGAIDTNHLHPATYALFTEMFQKLFSELSNEDRVEITHVIELAEKRRLTDDSISAVCPQAAPVVPKSK